MNIPVHAVKYPIQLVRWYTNESLDEVAAAFEVQVWGVRAVAKRLLYPRKPPPPHMLCCAC